MDQLRVHSKHSPTPSDSQRAYATSPPEADPFRRGTPMMFRTLIIAVVATLYSFGNSYAQLTQTPPNETGLALEVVFLKGKPPAYQPVAGSRSKKGGSWSSTDAITASDTLRSQLSSLSYEPDETEVASLIAAFPTLDKRELRISVEAAIHRVRKDLLD